MKFISYLWIPVLFVFMLSCLEEVETDSSYIKVFGKQGASSGKKLFELPNGDILIAGKLGVPAYDITWTTDDLLIGNAQDLGPAIMIADKSGRVKEMRTYPIGKLELMDIIEIEDYVGKASFTDIVQMNDGSFYALGEFRAFTVSITTKTDTLLNVKDVQNSSPFLMKLSPTLDLEFFRSLNGEPGWDTVVHMKPSIRHIKESDRVLILLGLDILDLSWSPYTNENPKEQGFSLLELEVNGDTVAYCSYSNDNVKFASNMNLDTSGNVILVGQKNNAISCFKIPLSSLELDDYRNYETSYSIIDSNIPFNGNESYIFPTEGDDYFIVYTQPSGFVWFSALNSLFRLSGLKLDITGTNSSEYPRAASMARNGDLLVYTEQLNSTRAYGYINRITPDKEIIFRKEVEGIPGDIMEHSDGSILVLSNPEFNGLLQKATITKLSANGN